MVTTNQIRDEYRLEATSVGVDKVAGEAQKLVTANEAVAKSTETVERKSLSVAGALDRFARANDNVFRMQQTVERGQALLNRAFDQGLAGTAAYERALVGLISRQQQLAAMTDEAAASAARLSASQRVQTTINTATGAGANFNTAGRAEDVAAYGASLDDLRSKFNPLFAAEQQFLAVQNEINSAAKVGAISEKERSAALNTARARFLDQTNEIRKSEEANARLTKGVGLNAYAWQNLSYQVNDVVTSLASGISPFQTLAQQGGQIYQILQSGQGGVGGALAAIKDRLLSISPLVGIFGVMAAGAITAAAAVYSVAKANRDVELALLGVGKGAGLSADQINDIAIRAAKAADITVSAAREIETAFLRSGKVFGEVFLSGTVAAENFSKASGQDRAKAAEFVAQSLSTLGSGGYEDLAKKAGNFDAKLEDQVRTLLNAGREMEAQQLVIDRFGQAFDKAGEKLTAFDRVIATVKSGASSLYDSLGRGLSGGVEMPEQLSRVEAAIKTRRAIATASGSDADTSDLEAKAAKLRAALKQTGDVAQVEAQRVRQNADAASKGAVSAIVPELASIEKIRQQSVESNKALNALEASGGSAERIDAAKKAVAASAAAEKDYANAGGPANMERAKAIELLKAGLQAQQAVTPAQKAEAARQQALAESFGALVAPTERSARANDAFKKSMSESEVQSRNQSRAMSESTKTANDLAGATAKTSKSVELLSAQRKVDEQIANGQIDASQRDVKIREQLQSQLSEVNKQAAERIRSAKDETSVQQGLNDKVAAGTMVSAEAQRRMASEAEISKLVREADAAQGEEKGRLTQRVQELRAATEAQLSAQDRAKVLSMSEDEQRRIDLLTKESTLLGETARERQKALIVLQAEQDLKKQGISLSAPESVAYLDKVKLRADLDTAKTEYERLAQDISSAVSGIFDDMFSKGNKGIAGFADSFSKGFSRIGTRMLEQNIIAPLIGGQGLDGKSGGGFLANLNAMFDQSKIEKAVSSGSEQGVFSGLASLLKPKSGASNGAFSQSTLAGYLLPAGVGASIGYQSQSPLTGLLGGALTGAATGGWIGAAVGAGAGLLGGLFGESQAKKEAKKKVQQELQARREALEQARPQIEQLSITFAGGSVGNVGKSILDAQAQLKQAAKTASEGGDQALADRLMADYQTFIARSVAVFREGLGATMDEVRQGFGTNGPFSQAVAQVQQLGESLKGIMVDAEKYAPAAAPQVRAAAVEGALSTLDAPKTLSTTQTELHRIAGTAAGLNQVLKDLGLSAEQTATVIAERTTKAIDALRDKFTTDLTRKINEARGQSYLNDAADLVKEVGGLRIDAGAVGADLGQVETYFQAAAQKIVDSSQLTGAAFQALVAQFPELTGVVHEFGQSAAEAAQAIDEAANRAAGYQDRLFAAQHRSDSLEDQLAIFDRQSGKDRAAEVKAGGQALVDLEAAQAAERANIIADFGQKAADALAARLKGYQDRLFAATIDTSTMSGALAAFDRQAQQDRADEIKAGGEGMVQLEAALAAERAQIVQRFWKQAQEAFDQFAANLKKFLDSLTAGASSPLSPQDRLAAAQAQYDQQLAAGRAGNTDALNGITGYAQSLLDASKAFYASSETFQDTFARVVADLTALPGQVGIGAFMKYADGGWVNGPGTSTSDSVLARLSAGEFVVHAAAANRYGPLLESINDNTLSMSAVALPLPSTITASDGGSADVVAELKAMRAQLEALEARVAEGNEIAEAGHLGTIAATKNVGAGIDKGNRTASRREVAA